MKVEDRIKSTKALSASKKAVINLLLSGNLVSNEMREALKPFGLSLPQFNVLRILRGQHGKAANLKTVQERMVHQSSNTTRIVDKLVEKKLAVRCVCPENRRKIEMKINESGLSLLKRLDSKVEQAEGNIVRDLDEKEQKTLNTLLEKLLND